MNVVMFCSFMKFGIQTDKVKNGNKKLASETKWWCKNWFGKDNRNNIL